MRQARGVPGGDSTGGSTDDAAHPGPGTNETFAPRIELVDSPTDLKPASRRYVLRKTLREFLSDQCTDLAAALTYYAVLAIFPALSPCCPSSASPVRDRRLWTPC